MRGAVCFGLGAPWKAERACPGHPQNPQKPHAGACGPLSRVLRVPVTAPFAGGTAPAVGPSGTGRPGRARKNRENRTCDDRAADYYGFYVTTSGSMVPGARGAGRGLWVVKGTIEALVPVASGGGTVVNLIGPHRSLKIQNTRTNHGELVPSEADDTYLRYPFGDNPTPRGRRSRHQALGGMGQAGTGEGVEGEARPCRPARRRVRGAVISRRMVVPWAHGSGSTMIGLPLGPTVREQDVVVWVTPSRPS
jgi:hypothetical protein